MEKTLQDSTKKIVVKFIEKENDELTKEVLGKDFAYQIIIELEKMDLGTWASEKIVYHSYQSKKVALKNFDLVSLGNYKKYL